MNNEIKVLDHGFVRLIDKMGTDLRIVESARISYATPSKGDEADKKLLHFLLKNKHTSPFEMCKITFNIRMLIFVMRQFVRHRMQNLNEVSARYTVLPNVFYIPTVWRAQAKVNKQGSEEADLSHGGMTELLEKTCKDSYKCYEELLRLGAAKEMARIVLPLNIYTEIYSTWDLCNLIKFFALRDDPQAQWEHQQFAVAMKEITRELFPWTMEAYDLYIKPKS